MTELYNKDGIKAGLEIEKRIDKKDPGSAGALAQVGERMAPAGTDYLGSAAVHYFVDRQQGQVLLAAQTPLGGIDELTANLGIKELAKAMMAYFGRKVPGLRDETPWDEQENG